jgi:hypothetical protein
VLVVLLLAGRKGLAAVAAPQHMLTSQYEGAAEG